MDCPRGKYSDAVSLTICTDCAKGFFQKDAGQTFCSACATGLYQGSTGGCSCIDCAPGFVNNRLNSSACTPCPLGREQSISGQFECVVCKSGTYAPSLNTSSCIPCPAGYANPDEEASICAECPRGRYADSLQFRECKECAAGLATNSTKTSNCPKCAAGKYRSATLPPFVCVNCDIGRASNEGSVGCSDVGSAAVARDARIFLTCCARSVRARYLRQRDRPAEVHPVPAGSSAVLDRRRGVPRVPARLCHLQLRLHHLQRVRPGLDRRQQRHGDLHEVRRRLSLGGCHLLPGV